MIKTAQDEATATEFLKINQKSLTQEFFGKDNEKEQKRTNRGKAVLVNTIA
jgi:hypothetical protein